MPASGFLETREVPKVKGSILGVLILRIIVYKEDPYFGNLPYTGVLKQKHAKPVVSINGWGIPLTVSMISMR